MQKLYDELQFIYDSVVQSRSPDMEYEVQVLDDLFKKYGVRSVVDLACGNGRHANALSERGYYVVGIDSSPKQIAQARKYSEGDLGWTESAEFIVGDVNSFVPSGLFDAAISLWTAIFEEPIKYERVFENVRASLRPRGIFVIETNTWNSIPEGGYKQSRREYSVGGEHITVEREDIFTVDYRVIVCDFNVRGKIIRDTCVTRLVAPAQLCEQLMKYGFQVAERIERTDGKRVFIVAQKL